MKLNLGKKSIYDNGSVTTVNFMVLRDVYTAHTRKCLIYKESDTH